MTTIAAALAEARAALAGVSDSPALDSEILLARALGESRTHLRAWPEKDLPADRQQAFHALLHRRMTGEPVAHITGEREFWSLPLQVTPDTLIPRPDTELLVELALEHLPARARVADLGTGSGAIALAIARERPDCRMTATDRSTAALAIARENARRLDLHNVDFLEADWCTGLAAAGFDLIASNPPYIPANDPHLAEGDVRFDPATALASGPDGLDDLRRLIPGCLSCLRPGGWLLVEHGYDQGTAARSLFADAGYRKVTTHRDLAGRERCTLGQRPE